MEKDTLAIVARNLAQSAAELAQQERGLDDFSESGELAEVSDSRMYFMQQFKPFMAVINETSASDVADIQQIDSAAGMLAINSPQSVDNPFCASELEDFAQALRSCSLLQES